MKKWYIFPLLAGYLMLISAGQLCARYGALLSQQEGSYNIYHLLSYFCLASRAPLWILILKNEELSSAYPLQGLAYPLILFLSFLVFGEALTLSRIAASLLIFAGATIILAPEKKVSSLS